MNKMIHLRIPETLYEDAKELSEEKGFSNVQEFIRNAVRVSVEKYELKRSIARLKALQGSMKGTPLTKEERKKITEETLKIDQSEIFREFNLE